MCHEYLRLSALKAVKINDSCFIRSLSFLNIGNRLFDCFVGSKIEQSGYNLYSLMNISYSRNHLFRVSTGTEKISLTFP